MKIKKFEGTTEKEVIENIKDELGLDALVLNIKKIQPKGIFSLLRKPIVEVTVAYDEKENNAKAGNNFDLESKIFEQSKTEILKNNKKIMEDKLSDINTIGAELDKDNFVPEEKPRFKNSDNNSEKIKSLEHKLSLTQEMLDNAMSRLSVSSQSFENKERKYSNNLIQNFYDELINQGVLSSVAEDILDEIDMIDDEDKIDINLIVKIVYNKITAILGEPYVIDDMMDKDEKDIKKGAKKAKIITFIGSTGVGKTTTIAKLSADFILKKNKKVSLITADTYRIAAVEQLKTYADILGVDVDVVYNRNDLEKSVKNLESVNDIIMIDTAGRSHKNKENFDELCDLLSGVPNTENYLVLSMTTKYEDLLNIINTYKEKLNFKLIFTKLDETLKYGSILNICYITGKQVSYITNGQNVPDDIEAVRPEKLAKVLLGLGENN